jgi:hypothetical protein
LVHRAGQVGAGLRHCQGQALRQEVLVQQVKVTLVVLVHLITQHLEVPVGVAVQVLLALMALVLLAVMVALDQHLLYQAHLLLMRVVAAGLELVHKVLAVQAAAGLVDQV